MTIVVSKIAESNGDTEYSIEAQGQEQARVFVFPSKNKVEVQLPILARTEPHTVVLAPTYFGVEYRDPDNVDTA